MFKCEACNLEFDNKATLLRHISHKKVCKLHYGDRFEDMKIDANLESKRKWWKNHADEAKKAYKLNQKEICDKEKQKYVKYDQRFKTDEGIAFREFYWLNYEAREKSALEDLKKSEFVSKKVREIAEQKAIDEVFWAEFWNIIRLPQFCKYFSAETEDFDEEDYPGEFEKAMEKAFEKLLEKQIEIEMKNWMDLAKKQLKTKCSMQCWESAFKMYFKDFCSTLFPSIQDKSFDQAFANFDETDETSEYMDKLDIIDRKIDENEKGKKDKKYEEDLKSQRDDKIEGLLKRKYDEALRDESMQATIDCEISFKLSERIESKIEKQIRAMKTQD